MQLRVQKMLWFDSHVPLTSFLYFEVYVVRRVKFITQDREKEKKKEERKEN